MKVFIFIDAVLWLLAYGDFVNWKRAGFTTETNSNEGNLFSFMAIAHVAALFIFATRLLLKSI